jgi:membrane protein implicated in regulation of membrane protease activity
MSFLIWLTLAVIFLIIEIIAPSFLFISLAISALFTGIIAYFTRLPLIQLPGFIAILAVFLFLLRPLLKRKTKENPDEANQEL